MNMRRRPLIAGGMALLAAPRTIFAQPAGAIPRIGVLLDNLSWDGMRNLRKAMGEYGYEEGRNVRFIVREWIGIAMLAGGVLVLAFKA